MPELLSIRDIQLSAAADTISIARLYASPNRLAYLPRLPRPIARIIFDTMINRLINESLSDGRRPIYMFIKSLIAVAVPCRLVATI